MKIVSWNINGIRARIEKIKEYIELHSPDILCFQELKAENDKFPFDEFKKYDYNFHLFGQKRYNGVGFLCKYPAKEIKRKLQDSDEDARLIGIEVNDIKLYTVYVPQGRDPNHEQFIYKNAWIRNLRDLLLKDANTNNDKIIFCGDFNVSRNAIDVHDEKYMFGKVGFHTQERESLEYLINWGLTDAFRELHPEEKAYSWWDYRSGSFNKNKGLRLDYFLCSKATMKTIKNAGMDREFRKGEKPSDHIPVWIEL